ncbi:MAG: DUF2752 domain-containing protein [Peptococcaceae bacterium]|jgi:hypothetical protein|nr:DUF2752 domain-containing protein [Peptococcaceae bacterium]
MKNNVLIFCIIVLLAFLFDFLGIRICLFYALFRLPCPGCGMTRAAKALMAGDVGKAFAYNFMIFPICLICLLSCFICIWKKTEPCKAMLRKRKKLLIGVSIVLVFIIWGINLKNPLLYTSL